MCEGPVEELSLLKARVFNKFSMRINLREIDAQIMLLVTHYEAVGTSSRCLAQRCPTPPAAATQASRPSPPLPPPRSLPALLPAGPACAAAAPAHHNPTHSRPNPKRYRHRIHLHTTQQWPARPAGREGPQCPARSAESGCKRIGSACFGLTGSEGKRAFEAPCPRHARNPVLRKSYAILLGVYPG